MVPILEHRHGETHRRRECNDASSDHHAIAPRRPAIFGDNLQVAPPCSVFGWRRCPVGARAVPSRHDV